MTIVELKKKKNFILLQNKRKISDIFDKRAISNANIVSKNIFILLYFASIMVTCFLASDVINLKICSKWSEVSRDDLTNF